MTVPQNEVIDPQRGRQPAVRLVDVHKRFGQITVLRGVSLECPPGTTTCLIGPSGSGKSTLLRCINGLESVDRGDVWVGETEVTGPGVRIDALRSRVGMVFQQFNLFPHLSAARNVTLALRHVRGMSSDRAMQIAREQLDAVGLRHVADRKPSQLSGGQQQRVAIARALVMEPELMLFDEATSALDPELVKEVLDIMRELGRSGMTMIVVTHEIGFAREAADHVVYIEGGQIIEQGPPDEVLTAPSSERLRTFLGKVL